MCIAQETACAALVNSSAGQITGCVAHDIALRMCAPALYMRTSRPACGTHAMRMPHCPCACHTCSADVRVALHMPHLLCACETCSAHATYLRMPHFLCACGTCSAHATVDTCSAHATVDLRMPHFLCACHTCSAHATTTLHIFLQDRLGMGAYFASLPNCSSTLHISWKHLSACARTM